MNEKNESSSKIRFNEKGKNAERLVHDLALKTFLTDWCYLNPKLPNGKELCDLLVIYDEVAIIWQIKELKLDEQGKYRNREVTKNLRQLSGARRRLFELRTPMALQNSRRGKEVFDATTVREVYLISVLLGEGEEMFSFVEELRNNTIHVFTRDFTQIVLVELDTINDFTNYLRSKERLLNKDDNLTIIGGEEDLLGLYLSNNRSFATINQPFDEIIIDQGFWEKLRNSGKYKEKKEQDKVSYGWDSIINRVPESSPEYELVARELARPNRFERRSLSKAYFGAYVLADKDTKYNVFRRTCSQKGVTYCFLFADETRPREYRREMLKWMCYVARGKLKSNRKVVGIATEKKASPTCSYDFVLLDIPEWTEQNQRDMETVQHKTGILLAPGISIVHEDEYPKEH